MAGPVVLASQILVTTYRSTETIVLLNAKPECLPTETVALLPALESRTLSRSVTRDKEGEQATGNPGRHDTSNSTPKSTRATRAPGSRRPASVAEDLPGSAVLFSGVVAPTN